MSGIGGNLVAYCFNSYFFSYISHFLIISTNIYLVDGICDKQVGLG